MTQPLPDRLPHRTAGQWYADPQRRGELELATEKRIIYVADPRNPTLFVGVDRSVLPATFFEPPQPPPTPQRYGIDPRAQVLAAGGAFAAGAGWGAAQVFSAVAGFGTGGMLAFALLFLATRMPARAIRGGDTINNIKNYNRWWGRSSTHN
ncbi:hypothetical protein [Streptomyces sp. N35]|uniref:hypothetical protein n=1 Tax=Streptomyces sp. N35 TaxID=2795730 RepID=UPI0018F55DD6|nr:hypothetical protein [Streptomyces sp. N35]